MQQTEQTPSNRECFSGGWVCLTTQPHRKLCLMQLRAHVFAPDGGSGGGGASGDISVCRDVASSSSGCQQVARCTLSSALCTTCRAVPSCTTGCRRACTGNSATGSALRCTLAWQHLLGWTWRRYAPPHVQDATSHGHVDPISPPAA